MGDSKAAEPTSRSPAKENMQNYTYGINCESTAVTLTVCYTLLLHTDPKSSHWLNKDHSKTAHPLVLVRQRVWSFDPPTGLSVLTFIGLHRVLVRSAQRTHPVTSVTHTLSVSTATSETEYDVQVNNYK